MLINFLNLSGSGRCENISYWHAWERLRNIRTAFCLCRLHLLTSSHHRDLMLQHLSRLELWVNWKKVKALPCAENPFSRYGVGLCRHDGVSHQRAHPISAGPTEFLQRKDGGITEAISEAPRAYGIHSRCHAVQTAPYETTSALVTQPVPRWALHHGTHRMTIMQMCCSIFSPWSDLVFLWAGVPLEQVSQHVVMTNASRMFFDATCNGQVASGSLAGSVAGSASSFRRFLLFLQGKHMLVHIDNTVTVSYINRQGGLQLRHMSQLVRHLLICSQTQLKSLHA